MGRVIDKRISDGSFEVGGSSGEIGDIIVGIVASEAELNTLHPAINYDDGTLAFVSNATERKLFFVLNGQWVWDIEFTSDRLDLLEQLVQDLKSGIQRMGNFNPKTNTPALPLIPLNSEYDAGNYLEIIGLAVGEEFTWNGFVLTNGDWVIVEKDGSDIILKWNKRNYGLFAKDIFYDNSVSGLLSNNLQGSTDEIIARLKVVENRSTGSGNAGEKYYISTPATGGIYKASKDFVTTSPTTIPLLLTNTYQTAFQAETDSLNTTILQSGDWNFDFDFTHNIDKDFVVKVLFYDNTTELGFVEANILAGSEKILLQKSFNQFAFTNGNKLKFEVQLKSTHGQTISFHTNNQDKNLHIHTPIVIDVVNSAVQSALNLKQDKIYDYAVEDITALNNLTGMLNGEIAFLKDTGKSYQYNTLTTLWVLIGGSEVATFINGQYIAQQYFKEMPVISSLFSAVTTWVNVSNLTELQAAVLIYDFRIKLTANITLTTNLVINKVGYIDLNGFQINTAQDGTAPVTMITLNQDVYFRNGTIKHLKTTNTSVETVIDGTNGGFYADNSIMLSVVEFGVKFEKGYIGCAFEYSVAGILNNNMRFISISGGTGNMFVDYVNFPTQPATVTRYTNAILFNPTRWVEGSTLVVRGCTDGEKLRQFFISESAVPTNMRAVFVNNDFDDLNGGIFTNYANPLDKFKSLVFINNKQGSASAGNYKGMFYLTASAGSNISIGTQAEIVFYNNKTTAGVLRAGYISLMQDGSGIFAIDTARFTDPVTRFANQSELMSAFALENLEKKLQTIIKEQPTLINKSGAGIFSKQSSFGDDVTSYATDALLTIGNRVAGSAEDKMTHFVGLTSNQINDITKVAGMIAYDTTKGKFVYQNGSALQTLITEADVASAVLTTQLRQTATIFVESTYGLDTNTGITPNLPYQTLAKAWTEITPSGEVKLLGAATLNTTHTFANTKQSIKTNIGISAKITGTIGLVVGNTSMQFQGGMFNATLNDGSNGTLYFENCNVGGSTFNFSNGGYKVIRSSSSAPTKINLTGTAGILYLENISGGEVDIDIGTGWIVYHINTQLKIGINNGTLINSTLINSVVTSQASLAAIVAITNNTANGFYILNFDSPVITGLTLSKGDIIYKVGAAHSKTFTFVSAPTSLDVYISATQRQTYIKQGNVWALAGGGGGSLTITYQANSTTFPANPGTGDKMYVTSDGTGNGIIEETWEYNGTDWKLIEGVYPVSAAVIDNTIADSQLIENPGRYIVPTTGLLNDFVGQENKYADFDGSIFTFTTPANNDTVQINSGPNAGQIWKYTTISGWFQTSSASATTTLKSPLFGNLIANYSNDLNGTKNALSTAITQGVVKIKKNGTVFNLTNAAQGQALGYTANYVGLDVYRLSTYLTNPWPNSNYSAAVIQVPPNTKAVFVSFHNDMTTNLHTHFMVNYLDGDREHLGHFVSQADKISFAYPYANQVRNNLGYHIWAIIPVHRAGTIELVTSQLSQTEMWVSRIAFTDNIHNIMVEPALTYHWNVNNHKDPLAAQQFVTGNNINWSGNWYETYLASQNTNSTIKAYARVRVIKPSDQRSIVLHYQTWSKNSGIPEVWQLRKKDGTYVTVASGSQASPNFQVQDSLWFTQLRNVLYQASFNETGTCHLIIPYSIWKDCIQVPTTDNPRLDFLNRNANFTIINAQTNANRCFRISTTVANIAVTVQAPTNAGYFFTVYNTGNFAFTFAGVSVPANSFKNFIYNFTTATWGEARNQVECFLDFTFYNNFQGVKYFFNLATSSDTIF